MTFLDEMPQLFRQAEHLKLLPSVRVRGCVIGPSGELEPERLSAPPLAAGDYLS